MKQVVRFAYNLFLLDSESNENTNGWNVGFEKKKSQIEKRDKILIKLC